LTLLINFSGSDSNFILHARQQRMNVLETASKQNGHLGNPGQGPKKPNFSLGGRSVNLLNLRQCFFSNSITEHEGLLSYIYYLHIYWSAKYLPVCRMAEQDQ